MQPPEGPPVCTALNGRPSMIPPPMSNTISRRDVPMGTSTRPVFTMRPASAKTLVPLLRPGPYDEYHSGPLRRMVGTLANVSTLLMSVGQPKRPSTAGYGGRGRGDPRLPSIEAIRAVSSPQTNAPAPSRIWMSKLTLVSAIPAPRRPARWAWRIAVRRRETASGYSARQ
jgi:hypothetical protein